jgi:hypothetical protein
MAISGSFEDATNIVVVGTSTPSEAKYIVEINNI